MAADGKTMRPKDRAVVEEMRRILTESSTEHANLIRIVDRMQAPADRIEYYPFPRSDPRRADDLSTNLLTLENLYLTTDEDRREMERGRYEQAVGRTIADLTRVVDRALAARYGSGTEGVA